MGVHNCNQSDRIITLELTTKNVMEEISELKTNVKTLDTKVDMGFKAIADKIDNLENKFVLRIEFRVAMTILWAISVILWVIGYFKEWF